LENDLYRLQNHLTAKNRFVIKNNGTRSNIELWHRRLGHITNESLNQLKDLNLVKGFSLKEVTYTHLCKGCVEGKQNRRKFPKDGGQ